MPSLQDFNVTFDDNKSIFSPGETLEGKIEITLTESMEMKEIRVKVTGKAHVGWHEQHGKVHVYHYNNQDLMEQNITVYGVGTAENMTLSVGSHSFPFSCTLPAPLPSSYEDKIGYIRYYVKATIVRPWKFDHNTKSMITILDILDLNKEQNMMAPSSGKENKYLCCLCCKSGPIQGEITTDRTGYVPGEWVIVNVKVNNKSGSKVQKTSIEIMKIVKYRAKMKSKTVKYSMQQVFGSHCDSKKSTSFDNIKIQIPALPPTENTHCKIIDINYAVMIHGHLRLCAIDLRGMAPIVIGSVPIRSLPMYSGQQDPQVQPAPSAYPSLPDSSATVIENTTASSYATTTTSVLPTSFGFQVPPPSYMDATEGNFDVKDDKYTRGDTTYTPKYTFYDWNQTAFTYNK